MTIEKQAEANRKNSLLSTGPITEKGKATVAQNALKHGIFSKYLIISKIDDEESQEMFQELHQNLIICLKPNNQLEHLLVEKIAVDFWRVRRVLRFESESTLEMSDMLYHEYYADERADRVSRYEKSLQNSFFQNIALLKKLQGEQ